MATPIDPRIVVGDTVVFEGMGLGRITALDERHVDIEMHDGSRRGVFGGFERLRLPVTRELAEAAIRRLLQPPRSTLMGEERFARVGGFARAEPKTQALVFDELLRLYGTSVPLTFGERGLVVRLERVIVGELACATGCTFDELVQRVRPDALADQLADR